MNRDETKIDLRIQRTKHAIQEALTELLMQKSLDKITITELAKLAHINRKTFYSHYQTLEDVVTKGVQSL